MHLQSYKKYGRPLVIPDDQVFKLYQVEDGPRQAADEKDSNDREENPEKIKFKIFFYISKYLIRLNQLTISWKTIFIHSNVVHTMCFCDFDIPR
jgi:hypothetical protein